MSKKAQFIDFVNSKLFCDIDMNEIDPEIAEYWEALTKGSEKEVVKFTDNGKLIMNYMQSLPEDAPAMRAKDIAEALFIGGRSVSGTMRKLVSDNYVEKIGKDPTYYCLTESGKTVTID